MANIKVRDEIIHLVQTIGADPEGFTAQEFRTLLLKINMGISKGATQKLFAKINGNEDAYCSAGEVLNFLRPWKYEYPHFGAYKLLKEVLMQTYLGRTPPTRKRKKRKKIRPVLNQDRNDAKELAVLQVFFDDSISSEVDFAFEFPDYRDSFLPATCELEVQQYFTLPMKFSDFLHYFGTSNCAYSAVDHTRMAGFDDPNISCWEGDVMGDWATRCFSCSTTFENVPSFVPIRTTKLKIYHRMKYIQPGATVLHFRTELVNGPSFLKAQYYHEVWEVKEIFGKCRVTYKNGLEWLQKSWFAQPLKSCACSGGAEAMLYYVQTISEKYHILKHDPSQNVCLPHPNIDRSNRPPQKKTRNKLLAAYASFTLFSFVCVFIILTYFNIQFISISLLISYILITAAIYKINPSILSTLQKMMF